MPKQSLFQSTIAATNKALDKIIRGEADLHFVESGVSLFINQNNATETRKKTRAVVVSNPTASILIKKKAFSTFKATNDLRWMDSTEKMLLRTTKALFAFKVAQLRAYESLTKLDKFYEETGEFNFSLLSDLILSTKYLQLPGSSNTSQILSLLGSFGVAAGMAASVDDVIKTLRRNAFSTANTKTTWIVDPDDVTNYGTGPGTGVIELCTFTNISTTVGVNSDVKGANISVIDPHRIMNIIEDDIETAIEESLYGTLGLMNDLAYSGLGGEYIDPVLTVSSAFELGGLGKLDPTIDVDYIRDRMRTFYLGKWMINVNDGIHVFVASNKSVFGNNFNDNELDPSYLEIDDSILEAERRLYTNQNISSETYKNLRKYANNSFTMQHVFGGYVKGISESYSPEKSTITITCQDNMGWLANVRYMEEPALMDPKAPLEDPLTPYDFKTISSSETSRRQDLELLSENKKLLKSGLLSFDSGLLNGRTANESNIFQGQYSGPGSFYGSQVVQHPSGLVYRWRSGVLAITSQFSPNGGGDGAVAQATAATARQQYGFTVANSVVSNLDVANVISVMVTGQPYNIETFTQQAVDAMNGMRQNNAFRPSDALSFVMDSIKKQGPFYGNFKPFRMITMSEQTVNRLSGDSFSIQENRSKISILRNRKNEIKKKISILKGNTQGPGPNDSIIFILSQEVASIDAAMQNMVNESYGLNTGAGGGFISSEDLFNTNFNIFGSNKILKNNGNLESDNDLSRAMMRVAATRRIEDVKLNRDQNLLIVSDQYDINPDIKAYVLGLKTSGFKLFQGNYLDTYTRCREAAGATMMEFFCNTQGHLEIRPPQYNKTPLTVLNALYDYQSKTNKTIVPDFLFKMFQDRISSLKLEIHYLNVRIAVLAMILGRYPDSGLIPGVPGKGTKAFDFFGINFGDKSAELDPKNIPFIPSINNFSIDKASRDLQNKTGISFGLKLGSAEDGDILDGDTETEIGNFDEITREFRYGSGQDSIYDFTLESLLNANKELGTTSIKPGIEGVPVNDASISAIGTAAEIAKSINSLISIFRREAGYDPGSGLRSNGDEFKETDILFNANAKSNNYSQYFDTIQTRLDFIFGEISKAVSKRNSLISILKKNKEKEEELQSIQQNLLSGFTENNGDFFEDDDVEALMKRGIDSKNKVWSATKSVGNFLYQAGKYTNRAVKAGREFLSGSANRGSLFDHLIDDDTRNLLGPGSGRRFIIYDEQIKSYEVRERDPEVTRIDVFGTTPLIADKMRSVTGGENLIQWAGAVDYDLWRQYGYKSKPINDAPFISDAETQAKPLALQHLAMQRAAIFSGSVQLAGNEYYQPGDTVYIPSKGLLFYVNSVSHSFSYGSSFDTSLDLVNGHAPGIYLPTPVDIIGQSYSKDMLKHGSYFVKRTDYGDNNYKPLMPDCNLRFPKSPEITSSNIEYLLSHKNNMVKFYNMVTDISNGILTPNRVLLIRGFVRNNSDPEIDDIKKKMMIVSDLFQNPVMLSQKMDSALGDDLLANSLSPLQNIFNINATSGMNKDLKTMYLPNGVPVVKVRDSQIILQLVNLNKDALDGDNSSLVNRSADSFRCFSPAKLKESFNLIKKSGGDVRDIENIITGEKTKEKVDAFDYLDNPSYFPRGGPSQSTWLEMDDLLQNISTGLGSLFKGTDLSYEKVIEIGILELDPSRVKLLMSFNKS